MAETINNLSANQPMILVAHSASSEKSYFQTLGLATTSWQTGFPKINLDRPAEEATNTSLQDGQVYVIDTQQLFAASGLPGALPQTGLAKVLSAMQIPARRLHNAGNDAYCKQCTDPQAIFIQADQYIRKDTLAVYEALAGTGVLKADLVEREADRVKQERAQKQKDSANNGWGS